MDTSDYHLIPLETSDSCLLSDGFLKIIPHKDYLYIFDKKAQGLFIFNYSGKLVKKIQTVGEGPYDYTNVIDMCIASDTVFLMNYGSRKVLKYDLQGKLIGTFSAKKWVANNIIPTDSSLICINDWSVLSDNTYKIYQSDFYGKIIKTELPMIKIERGKFIVRTDFRYSQTKENTHIIFPFEPYIYHYDEKGLIKQYYIDFSDKWW